MPAMFDRWLILSVVSIVGIGLLMVASSSIVISNKQFGTPFHYLIRQIVFLGMGTALALFIVQFPTAQLQRISGILLLFILALLVLVLIPGIGHQVNGSMRWLKIGPFGLQVSELAKLGFIIYLSGYLVRYQDEVKTKVTGFIKPLAVLVVVAFLLLLEPDFGTLVVITITSLALLFLAGVRVWQFAVLLSVALATLSLLAVVSPYRLTRLMSFLNPWANQFDSGYQLTQSLIAFGRGSWFGTGLGESVQKLFYLPEAHTDFLFAVLAEELGLFGIVVVISLFTILVSRALLIGRRALENGRVFAAFLAFGIGFWIGLQAMISMGVNSGVLPTKGLTLPLMSYGGSSLLVMCVAIALLIRIDIENRSVPFVGSVGSW